LDSTAEYSNCPTSKSVIVTLLRSPSPGKSTVGDGGQDETGADRSHKSDPEPHHLS
jgi:formate dehydrogenase major subunit